MNTRIGSLLVSVVALLSVAGCAVNVEETESTGSVASAIEACTPAVIVVRHADDIDPEAGESCRIEEQSKTLPDGSKQKIHQSCLTNAGKKHAELYAETLGTSMASEGLCQVKRVITQDPWGAGAEWPSANAFETILPFAVAENAPIEFLPSDTKFDAARRESVRPEAGESIVIAWDSKGLSGSSGLLASMRKTSTLAPTSPARDSLYVFTNADANAKFDLVQYTQFFQDSSGYFAKVTGKSFLSTSSYRFFDGELRSRTAYSPDLVPSAMRICRGTTCGADTVSLDESMRK